MAKPKQRGVQNSGMKTGLSNRSPVTQDPSRKLGKGSKGKVTTKGRR